MPHAFFFRHTLPPLVLLLAAALLLCACVVPEHYVSRIKIEADGSYKLYAEGTAVHIGAFRALKLGGAEAKGGKHKSDEQKKGQPEGLELLQKDLEKYGKDPRFIALSPLGDGRVRFAFDGAWSLDKGALIVSQSGAPITYAAAQDGTWRLRVRDAVHSREARSLGVKTEGDLSVVLAPGIEVLEHNAKKVPTTPNGAYRWRIDETTTEAPYLRIRFPLVRQDTGGPKDASHSPKNAPAQKGLAHQ